MTPDPMAPDLMTPDQAQADAAAVPVQDLPLVPGLDAPGGGVVPPMVYVPAPDGTTLDALQIDVRPTSTGRHVVLVYSSLDRLVAGAGDRQTWTLMRTEDVAAVATPSGPPLLVLDRLLPASLRRGAPGAQADPAPWGAAPAPAAARPPTARHDAADPGHGAR